jgi:hypothetical protein
MRHATILPGLLLLALTAPAHAGRGLGEARLLRPGRDSNLNWVEFHEVAEEAARTRKPVMIYFFEGEKSQENLQPMINAQLRLFPESDVKSACAGLICTKVEWTRPELVERAAAREMQQELKRERRDERRRRQEEGEDQTPGEEEGDGPEGDDPGAEETEPETFEPFFLPPEQWAKGVAIYFCDYQGRVLTKVTRITTNERSFVSTIKKVKRANDQAIKKAEREAEKAAEEAAKQERERQEELERQQREQGEDDPEEEPERNE